jgi:hypothetical protein
MDSKKIDELLKRYWNAESSLEEENELRQYFKSKQIPDHLKEAAALFLYFDSNKKKTISDVSFDAEVMTQVRKANPGKVRSLVINAMRIAAGVAVLVLAIWFVREEVREDQPQAIVDTYEDPKMAFEETKKALLMISKSFGTAEEQAKKINLFNEAQEEIQKKPEIKN